MATVSTTLTCSASEARQRLLASLLLVKCRSASSVQEGKRDRDDVAARVFEPCARRVAFYKIAHHERSMLTKSRMPSLGGSSAGSGSLSRLWRKGSSRSWIHAGSLKLQSILNLQWAVCR